MFKTVCKAIPALLLACVLAACASISLEKHLTPLSKDTAMLLGKKGMDPQSPMFIRVFKEESELEVWKQRSDGRYYHLKTYPICNWSGALGPKTQQGDHQAPEGFYTVAREQMKPDSKYYLAMNLGYPNAYDKAHKRTGEFLMIHGSCKSVGCYAMTDALMEEIYAIARESFLGGNETIHVHAFPFRMTPQNMARHTNHEAYQFWGTLKEGYDYFELTRQIPTVAVCNKRYVVNVSLPAGHDLSRLNPEGACPVFTRPRPEPFVPRPGEQAWVNQRVVVPGTKTRDVASIEQAGVRYGLTRQQNGTASTGSVDGIASLLGYTGSNAQPASANMSYAPRQ